MIDNFDEIILSKPLLEATFLDWCKGTSRQRSLKEMKEASLELSAVRMTDSIYMSMERAFRHALRGSCLSIRQSWPHSTFMLSLSKIKSKRNYREGIGAVDNV